MTHYTEEDVEKGACALFITMHREGFGTLSAAQRREAATDYSRLSDYHKNTYRQGAEAVFKAVDLLAQEQ